MSLKTMGKSLSAERFTRYLDKVKKAKTDYEILNAGYLLVEEYRGFRYAWLSSYAKKFINLFCGKGEYHDS